MTLLRANLVSAVPTDLEHLSRRRPMAYTMCRARCSLSSKVCVCVRRPDMKLSVKAQCLVFEIGKAMTRHVCCIQLVRTDGLCWSRTTVC